MVQLDWLRPMRHPRRPSFGRVQRRPMHVSQTVAELLEQRSLLSAVLTTMPVDDSAVSDDATQLDDSVVDDCADDTIAECSAVEVTSDEVDAEWTDVTTDENGEPVKVIFYSLGATGEEP